MRGTDVVTGYLQPFARAGRKSRQDRPVGMGDAKR